MITSGEGSGAEVTLEGFLSGVFPVVSGQLVGPCKLPAATLPRAGVRLLASVRPLVSFQVRTLCVNLSEKLQMKNIISVIKISLNH